jgi:predicted metal-dependent hydrolase
MAFKQFHDTELGEIVIYKRRGSHSIRMSLTNHGQVRINLPLYVSYTAGLAFARQHHQWVNSNRVIIPKLVDGQLIGKAHRLEFQSHPVTLKPVARIQQTVIKVSYPVTMQTSDQLVQRAATAGSIRALRLQSERLLPLRLAQLATTHDFSYNSVVIKQLKRRWGSCDQAGQITLNLFLIQLSWEYIDYVLLHELTHTKILNHGSNFWDEMEKHLPSAKQMRHKMRAYQPILGIRGAAAVA